MNNADNDWKSFTHHKLKFERSFGEDILTSIQKRIGSSYDDFRKTAREKTTRNALFLATTHIFEMEDDKRYGGEMLIKEFSLGKSPGGIDLVYKSLEFDIRRGMPFKTNYVNVGLLSPSDADTKEIVGENFIRGEDILSGFDVSSRSVNWAFYNLTTLGKIKDPSKRCATMQTFESSAEFFNKSFGNEQIGVYYSFPSGGEHGLYYLIGPIEIALKEVQNIESVLDDRGISYSSALSFGDREIKK